MSPCHRCRFSRCNSPRCGSIEAGGEVFPPNKKCQPTHPGVCNVYRMGAHGRWTCWILDDSGFFPRGRHGLVLDGCAFSCVLRVFSVPAFYGPFGVGDSWPGTGKGFILFPYPAPIIHRGSIPFSKFQKKRCRKSCVKWEKNGGRAGRGMSHILSWLYNLDPHSILGHGFGSQVYMPFLALAGWPWPAWSAWMAANGKTIVFQC